MCQGLGRAQAWRLQEQCAAGVEDERPGRGRGSQGQVAGLEPDGTMGGF